MKKKSNLNMGKRHQSREMLSGLQQILRQSAMGIRRMHQLLLAAQIMSELSPKHAVLLSRVTSENLQVIMKANKSHPPPLSCSQRSIRFQREVMSQACPFYNSLNEARYAFLIRHRDNSRAFSSVCVLFNCVFLVGGK